MFNKIKSLFDTNQTQFQKTASILSDIKVLEPKVKEMSYEQIKARVQEMKNELKVLVDKVPEDSKSSLRKVDRVTGLPSYEKDIQKKLMEFLPEVYAFMNEVFRRKFNFTYHDVQLQAAIILAQGQRLVELYTGEGKTMTFQLPLVLYSLVGRGAHLVTVNDYLSKRDGEYAGHIASELGLSVGIVASNGNYKFIGDDEIKAYKGEEGEAKRKEMILQINNMDGLNLAEVNKKESYNTDITYGTNNEFGFDYLRDNMAWEQSSIAQRELYFCIIDEADSILIDEARTPLIISGIPSDADTEKYINFARAVDDLVEGKDYVLDHKTRSVSLTEEGITHVEKNLGMDNLWKDYATAYHIENALKAKAMFTKDDQYLVKNGEVLIVDEFTGRVLKGRRYSEGLHQAIEAKENVDIKQESKTYATITFQNYFRLYKVLSGGSGTVLTEAEEFFKIYGLESVAIPTNRPVIRRDDADLIFKNQDGKFRAVVRDIKERHGKGQPVLVGTTSVEKSEIVSSLLDKEGIKHEVLNAKYHEQEAKIIAEAGRKGSVTVATNMAGRGADIVIGGGTRGDAAWKEISEVGGLHVIGTERHEARRIDNQLRGRTGRQGEPGSSRFYVALDDQLMKILGGDMMGRLMGMVGLQEDMPIELKMISRQIETAQKRIEGMNFDSRKRVVEYDDVMNQHREIFYSRRRNILKLSEEADGKIVDNGKTVDVNSKENEAKKEFYSKKVLESQNKLKESMRGTFLKQLLTVAPSFFSKHRRISKDNVNVITKFLSDYLPSRELAKALDIREGEIRDKLEGNLLELKDEDSLIDNLRALGTKVFDLKMSDFAADFYNLSKVLTLQEMDNLWVDHLELMKDIKEGISLQSYAQKDPLVEYKNEAFTVFESFIRKVDDEIAKKLLMLQKVPQAQQIQEIATLQTNTSEIDDISEGAREFMVGQDFPEVQVANGSVRASDAVKKALEQRRKTQSSLSTNAEGSSQTKGKSGLIFGRNDKISVRYSDGRELKDVKFKKVEEDVKNGLAIII